MALALLLVGACTPAEDPNEDVTKRDGAASEPSPNGTTPPSDEAVDVCAAPERLGSFDTERVAWDADDRGYTTVSERIGDVWQARCGG
ncbi:hypothetical protein ER308_16320 [Egibacter rhizosphaerae]|uniref:Uncharacterized protein n=1 Tax=Egibacter rhizosphaerae TaxID=1670831 RepID=A0A411YI30_9ACTN|nr:hypothetical protein [Egibacter rhizosphaerae]QBI20985.1 hypothetical protein ER308_16320 [Egibacter rhizosphaerae]